MDMNVSSALVAYTYQNTLAQTGSTNQALSQALAAGKAQAANAGALLDNTGSADPLFSLGGGSSQALASLTYTASAASGNGPKAVQDLLASLGSSSPSLFSGTDNLPMSAAILSPTTTEALVRHAYDQSQDPTASAQQAVATGQQALLTAGLNLLA